METIKFTTHVGSDGLLKLEVPVNVKDTDLEVVIIMYSTETRVDELGWPVGFFEETFGSLADDPIERPPQGEYEVRDEML